jgi:hypothetical protein
VIAALEWLAGAALLVGAVVVLAFLFRPRG